MNNADTAPDERRFDNLLRSSNEMEDALVAALGGADYAPYDLSARVSAAASAANVAWEHARAARLLVEAGLFTSSLALTRLQHEALTRSIWLTYVASDSDVNKLSAPISKDAEAAARKLPMTAEMLEQLSKEPKAAQALTALQAFKTNNAPALNSFVHGGLHALQRHALGYPVGLIEEVIRNSNGLLLMTAMSLAMLSNQPAMARQVIQIQMDKAFSGVFPAR